MIEAKAIIGVPFFNEKKYLRETLECLEAIPADVDVKFFLCDNVSDDGSSDIAREFADKDERFVYHLQDKNIGATNNFKYAFNESKSEYFMWLGAHDVIDATYPQAAIDAFEKHEGISYAAAIPYAFKDNVDVSIEQPDAMYKNLNEDRLVRYLESVGKLNICTILNSFFRRSFLDDFVLAETISWDHVLISHLLWHGPIHYVEGQRYLRRYFESEISREEKMAGTERKSTKYPRIRFYEFYVDDFKKLYDGHDELASYLCSKILGMLEKRFGFQALNPKDLYS